MSENIFPPEKRFKGSPNECRHGRLAHKCEICALEEECDQLRKENERLKKEMPVLMHLQVYNDIKKAVAARYAEIANDAHACSACRIRVIDDIRKEFNL